MTIRVWLSADEIANEALPELPNTKRGMNALIDRQGWNLNPALSRQRAGRTGGGGMEYHIDILPLLAQVAYKQKYMVVSQQAANDVDGRSAPRVDALSATARLERDARLAILRAFALFSKGMTGIGQPARMQLFADRYEMGNILVDEWVKETVPSFSKRTLARWRSAEKKGNIDALAVERGKSRRGTAVLDIANNGAVKAFILAVIAQNPHLSGHQVRTQCRAQFGDELTVVKAGAEKPVNIPPVRTFQRTLKDYKMIYKVELTKINNPDRYRSIMRPSGVGALSFVKEPNKLWQIDASPVDALCVDGRHSVYACIDIATRRTLFFISRTPRATAVALLLRKAILAWGVPEKIKTDNGSDFVAKDTKRLFASLNIEMELSDAYSPQQKGHVERVIKTFQHDFAALLPGYVGHSVADRKDIENRKSFAARLGASDLETFGVSLSGPDLQKLCDRWVNDYYQHKPHAGLNNKTPFEVAATSTAEVRTVDAHDLDLLLMPVAGTDGYRQVTKFGIRIDHHHYMTPGILPGQRVFVRQDPNDVGLAYAFEEDGGKFLGECVCAELAGIHPSTLVKATREMQAELINASTAQIRRDMREMAKGKPLIERALEVAARDVPNVVALPKRTVEHETPHIVAAREVNTPKTSATPDAAIEKLQQELIAEEQAKTGAKVTPLRREETRHQRFKRALDIENAVSDGTPVSDRDLGWLEAYRTGPEYRSMHDLFEESGGSMSL